MNGTLTVPLRARQTTGRLDFDALYRSSRDDVYAYVATMLGDRAAAEDVTALAFERALRGRAGYRPGKGSERAWLFGIARNAALDELRRRKRLVSLLAEPADVPAASDDDGPAAGSRGRARSAGHADGA